jgi:hypothetical protein
MIDWRKTGNQHKKVEGGIEVRRFGCNNLLGVKRGW